MSHLGQSLTKVIRRWPQDPLQSPTQLKSVLEVLANSPGLTPRAVGAAQALCEDAAKKQYPLSEKMLRPRSSVQHYERLVQNVHKSAKGIERSWWQRFFNTG
ncbi:hypothetical protein AG1IA_02444 [Rhizoctonia solani AG-1 IA]|uniref:Uncharacterized protein n=2 Tax=Rhizoctonia solani TaxID=456999 RepID=A0A8H2XFC7_9AGAM|nr:uncharacterized protein RhiXN_05189 [Rhizoctonia solani]ELU43523.1 hypothetical protein AG1IA_02444 [Rhizoctonia solani AG-1 IA]KAF8677669.1 hypothetical protein RHS04_05729 [Rhizoctonia solani]KAF8757942.1 hypothetical protein RHS01_03196 [Rhizoctonia solani]QRW17187.1 hypothetical protein RhiXN_05189 [Rhizoctonia solani]CAE6425274.1 unnamed protein product [Rhizoctonia solani]